MEGEREERATGVSIPCLFSQLKEDEKEYQISIRENRGEKR